jgi:hypothetical protein
MRVSSGDELIAALSSLRPIGVLLILGEPQLIQGMPWLRILERKIIFEGLRVVAALKNDVASPGRVFGSKVPGYFHLAQCLGIRDFLTYDDQTTDSDMGVMIGRIQFGFGLTSKSPFETHFRLTAAHEELLEIGLPSRISHVEDDLHFVLESSAFLVPGSRIRMRLMGLSTDTKEVSVTVLENLPSGLRFNFGNSVRLRLDDDDRDTFHALIKREGADKLLDRPVRRAMVITKSPSLRHRIVSVLSSWQIESRVPLVRRNIRGDLPPLQPDYLIIEPSFLAASDESSGVAEVRDLLALAGSDCHAVIVGRRPDWNFRSGPQVSVMRDSANLSDDLSEIIERSPGAGLLNRAGPSGRGARRWFATDAQGAKVFLLLHERTTALSENGIEIETPQVYRLWSNLEVRGNDSKIHFVGRVSKVFRVEDAFRTLLKLGARDKPLFRCQISCISPNPVLQATFRSACSTVQGSFVPLNPRGAAAAVLKTSRPARDFAVKIDHPADYGRNQSEDEKTSQPQRWVKNLGIILILVVAMGLAVAAAFLLGGADKIYGESFERLFELRDRRGGSLE